MRRLLAAVVLLLLGLPAAVAHGAALPALSPLHGVPNPRGGVGRIVDAQGSEVVLRGVNHNAFGGYWQGTSLPPVFPFSAKDPGIMQAIGWNTVRLVLSWSRVEPQRGVYDEAYLNRIAAAVRAFAKAGVYTIVDMHQDAWSATLFGRPGEVCPDGMSPALGWDGAPAWATLVPADVPRCFDTTRERNPAVERAWSAFFADEQDLQGAFADMWRHVARRFAREKAVAAFDILNEPGAYAADGPGMTAMYRRALAAIRRGERDGRGFSHLVFIEPSIFSTRDVEPGVGVLERFSSDRNLVWSPHIYDGAFGGGRAITREPFDIARADAKALGGLPVVVGEWGGEAARTTWANNYFLAHQALQDRYRYGAVLWLYRQSCGDPHKAGDLLQGRVPIIKGVWEVSCPSNRQAGPRPAVVASMTRGWVRAAPGRLTGMVWNGTTDKLLATGAGARRGARLLAFYPGQARARSAGLRSVRVLPGPKDATYVVARARGGPWRLSLSAAR